MNLFADFDLKPVKSELLKVDGPHAYVRDEPGIRLHASGIVSHRFKHSKSIIARVSVIQKENGLAKLEFKVFDSLEQEALPLPNILPEVGDEVLLNFLYDRAVAIAPDRTSHDWLVQKFPSLYFTHIDVLGARLIRANAPAPKRADFRKFCSDNAVGILAFALRDKIKLVDCQDFHVLYEEDVALNSSTQQAPFYSRIEGYRSDFFNINSEEIGDFYRYYETLIDPLRAR